MVHAPLIISDTWYNSPPLTKEDLKDKVILIDFWTYTCVNCLRTLPYISEWWRRYKDKGLVVIGVHTPEFEIEKDPHNVVNALKKLDITWPIAIDNNYYNWNQYANKAWPAKYLIDKKGNIVYQHFGEGAYEETEMHIQKLLNLESGIPLSELSDHHNHGKACYLATPETYCGYNRGELFNQDYHEDQEYVYTKPKDIPINSLVLNGKFFSSSEFVSSRSEGSEVIIHFTATEVNLVLSPEENRSVVEVTFQEQNLEPDIKGYDVSEASEIVINEPKLYNIIKSNELLDGILKIKSVEGQFNAYVFTFSGCKE